MSVDPTQLMQQVYDYFKHLYPSSAPDAFLAFEALGFPVNTDDFLISGVSCPPLAVQWLSGLTNKAIVFQNSSILHSSMTVDGLVGLMLNGSMPADADSMVALGAAKTAASTRFDITLQSLSGIPNDVFHPVTASPATWFNPAAAANWSTYTLGQPPAPAPAPPSPPRPPIPIDLPPLQWRIPPQPTPAPVFHPMGPIPGRMHRPDMAIMDLHPGLGLAETVSSAANLLIPPAHPALAIASQPSVSALIGNTLIGEGLTTFARPSAGSIALDAFAAHPQFAANTALRAELLNAAPVRLATMRQQLAATATVSATAAAQPVSSSSFYATFDYCIVSLDWPWLDQSFLLLRDWYVPGYLQSTFSASAGAADPGLLPALPSALLLIRNLKISAQWAQSDITALGQAAGLGPFSLAGHSFNTQTGMLTSPGMQIIGWFCSALPQLPPCPDPKLATPAPAPAVTTSTGATVPETSTPQSSA